MITTDHDRLRGGAGSLRPMSARCPISRRVPPMPVLHVGSWVSVCRARFLLALSSEGERAVAPQQPIVPRGLPLPDSDREEA
jgi:hypothetical protein